LEYVGEKSPQFIEHRADAVYLVERRPDHVAQRAGDERQRREEVPHEPRLDVLDTVGEICVDIVRQRHVHRVAPVLGPVVFYFLDGGYVKAPHHIREKP